MFGPILHCWKVFQKICSMSSFKHSTSNAFELLGFQDSKYLMPLCIIHGVLVFFFQIIYYGFNFRPKKGGDPDSIILVGMSLSDAWWEKPAKHGGLSLRGTLERGGPQEYLRKFFCVFFFSVLSVVLLRSHIPSNAFFVDWWTELPIWKASKVGCQVTIFRGPAEKGYPFLKAKNFNETFGMGHRHHRPSAKCHPKWFFSLGSNPTFSSRMQSSLSEDHYIFPQQQNAMFFLHNIDF